MSLPADLSPALNLCGSAPHRAVLGLLAVALGRPAYSRLTDDLQASAPEQIAAIANQSHVQVILNTAFERAPMLQDAIPRDLLIYFAEMQRANRERNVQAIHQIEEIASILAPAGIPVLALKGAADVLLPIQDPPYLRYISDLDLLIPADRATEAASLLRIAKALSLAESEIQPGPHHHMAQISSPEWLFTVELHLRPGSPMVCQVLKGEEMFARAIPSSIVSVVRVFGTDGSLN